jgi:hypothetical protein
VNDAIEAPVVAAEAPAIRIVPRALRADDERFVVDSWRRSWRNSNDTRRESGRAYHALFEDVVLRGVIAEETTKFLIVASEGDLDEIVGWICYTPGSIPTVHFGYVRAETRTTKQPVRLSGVFSAMLHFAGVTDRLVYTFRPAERPHPRDNRTLGVENALLAAAHKRGIEAIYRPILEFLGRSEDRDHG